MKRTLIRNKARKKAKLIGNVSRQQFPKYKAKFWEIKRGKDYILLFFLCIINTKGFETCFEKICNEHCDK